MVAEGLGLLKQVGEDLFADAFAVVGVVNKDGVLDGASPAFATIILGERAPAHDFGAEGGDDDGVFGTAGFEPLPALIFGLDVGLPGGGRSPDVMVMDFVDSASIR